MPSNAPSNHEQESSSKAETAYSWQFNRSHNKILRPNYSVIDTAAFTANIKSVKKFLEKELGKKPGIIAVVKANAYGHGAVPLAKVALKCGVAYLGVASIEEGISLRQDGIKTPILILGSIFPLENLQYAARYNLVPTISSLYGVSALSRLAKKLGRKLSFHLKVDVGMGRIGLSTQSAFAVLKKIVSLKEIVMEGLYTHFPCADNDLACTKAQFKKFLEVVKFAKSLKLKFSSHCANSSALLKMPQSALDLVRPGLLLYGLEPFEGAGKKISIKPVLSWKAAIVFLKRVRKETPISYGATFVTKRNSIIATIPTGYADGYARLLSGKAQVLVRGVRCPVVGRVTMDMIMADVSDVPGVSIGDEVVLLGVQGVQRISAQELAKYCDTINYEITCQISARVPRVFI